ncbi:DMT family transporter [Litorisediminicola beolgyonensis]|uniref:DMT family transporter n=1 Tax=Litorisediminicola beolgyonensis TaxID=1173614 RepID=A0ABW3ZI00_9RHOB
MSANLRGALFMVLAMIGFAIEDALFKSATGAGLSPGLGTLIFGLLGFTAFFVQARRKGPVWSPAFLRGWLLIRTGFEILGRVFFALSLAYTPLATTSAILQATPLVVTLGAALALGEQVGPRRWAAMAVGFCGVLLILRPGPDSLGIAALLPILGMIGFAGRDLATRASPPEISSAQLGVLGFGVVSVAGLLILVSEGALPAAPAPLQLMKIGGVALAGVLAYTALTRAMRSGEVSVVAPFRYSRLLVALVFAYAFFGERPDSLMLVGATLIVVSGVYTLWRSGRA